MDNANKSLMTGARRARVAQLVAAGEMFIPTDLSPAEMLTLIREVSDSRRQRLIVFVARTIADDIRRSLDTGMEAHQC